ncbi:uncharacterized protein LAESUDRAFT_716394 [Laetiporus sulphureus 93-53]|uniref:Uncharacterized protein n=1 Tax=Laetiporus sulphureus 93-53 TaxID=1314785 RepID=A0A165CQ25_9APHY|nr:uncharacterized protein LAESUDRAFT_716394 [Laetiporus sulphureus 93-53]KZT03212.1 hypothetical protein LAESUDRAFT_716394 [Laetiporus sulphureus 93-53]
MSLMGGGVDIKASFLLMASSMAFGILLVHNRDVLQRCVQLLQRNTDVLVKTRGNVAALRDQGGNIQLAARFEVWLITHEVGSLFCGWHQQVEARITEWSNVPSEDSRLAARPLREERNKIRLLYMDCAGVE